MPRPASPASRVSTRGAIIESLERRTLMAATISGAVVRDLTGNGITADDPGLAGVVVTLYKDKNANGVIDAADGAALGTRTSAATTGVFAFAALAKGKYLLQETPGANQIRTGPFLTDTLAVNVTKKKGVFGGNVFANYVKDFDRSVVSAIRYSINGAAPVATMAGVKQGDTVTVHFTVAAGKTVTLSLVSYTAPEPFSTAENLQLQEIFQADTNTFTGGAHTLTVTVPDCYFQLDFVGGLPIDPFGPAGSNILYALQGRRIDFVNGGTEACGCEEPEPPVCEETKPCEEPKPSEERDPCEDKQDRGHDDRDDRKDDDCDDKGDRRDKKKSRKSDRKEKKNDDSQEDCDRSDDLRDDKSKGGGKSKGDKQKR